MRDGWVRRWLPILMLLGVVGALRPQVEAAPRRDRPIRPKVLHLIYDPVVEAEGGKRLHEVCRWNDAEQLAAQYVADIKETSGGFVQYRGVETRVLDDYPRKKDGFRYTDESYLACFRSGKGWHQPDAVDYLALLEEFDIPRRIERKELDEVWVSSMP